MGDLRSPEQIFRAMWRGTLADPASVDLNKANFDFATVALAPRALRKALQIQACLRPTPENQHFVLIARRLELGRRHRRRVMPRIGSTRTVDLGDGLVLRFVEHAAAGQFMERVLPADGIHEPELVGHLKRSIRQGDLVVDIGSHAGYVACIAAALGATVIAVEMQPTMIPIIQANAIVNELWTVHPLCAAISDRSGMVPSFRLNPSPGVQSAVWHWDRSKFPIGSVNHDCVPRLTLDSLFPGPERPALVKIDVEGAEGLVLAGARELIRGRRTSFIVEVHARLLDRFGTTLADLLAPFEPDGWSLSLLTPEGQQPMVRESFLSPTGTIATHVHNAPVLFEPRPHA